MTIGLAALGGLIVGYGCCHQDVAAWVMGALVVLLAAAVDGLIERDRQ